VTEFRSLRRLPTTGCGWKLRRAPEGRRNRVAGTSAAPPGLISRWERTGGLHHRLRSDVPPGLTFERSSNFKSYNSTRFSVLIFPGQRFTQEEAHIRIKTTKPPGKTPFHIPARVLLAAIAVLALSSTQLSASEKKPVPASSLKKLDTQLVLALKKMRGESPFDKPASLEPDIPFKHNGRVLVDLEARVSTVLLSQIVRTGGWVDHSSVTPTTLRAMIPFSQLEALADRADIKSISPAHPTHRSGVKASTAQ